MVGGSPHKKSRQKPWYPKIYDTGITYKSKNKRAVTRRRRRLFNVLTLLLLHPEHIVYPKMLLCNKGTSNSPSAVASEITTPVPLHWAIFMGRLPRGEILDKPPQPNEHDDGAAAGHLPANSAIQPYRQALPPHPLTALTPPMNVPARRPLSGPPTPPTKPTRPLTTMEEMGDFSPILPLFVY